MTTVCDVCQTPVPKAQQVWCFKETANVVVKDDVFIACQGCGPVRVQISVDVVVKYREAKPCSWCGVVHGDTLKMRCDMTPGPSRGGSSFTVWACRKCTDSWLLYIQYPPVAELMYLRPPYTEKEIDENCDRRARGKG